MGEKTKIAWTHIIPGGNNATWNPLGAINKKNYQSGYFCIPRGPGCLNCYAKELNLYSRIGNGLDYTRENLEHAEIFISGEEGDNGSQKSISWPLRSRKSAGIFPVSMSDWCGEFVDPKHMNLMLAVMMLAQHHIFITLTKRHERLHDLLLSLTGPNVEGMMLNYKDRTWVEALVKAHGNYRKFPRTPYKMLVGNQNMFAVVPWPPPNIFFGFTIVNRAEAKHKRHALENLKKYVPGIQLIISYEPALEPVDWMEEGYSNLVDWLIVGGESGDPNRQKLRRMSKDCVDQSIRFMEETGTPLFVKQTGTLLGQELGLKDSHGVDVPQEWAIRQFPNVKGRYIPWK